MRPETFLQRPAQWLQTISRYENVTSGAPNFAYELCLRKITERERGGLDLSGWLRAGVAAEPVRPDTLERFSAAFAPYGFRPSAFYSGYGLAEATVSVRATARHERVAVLHLDKRGLERGRARVTSRDNASATRLVGCGRSVDDDRAVVVHPQLGRKQPDGTLGEIWVAGPHVALGYWNREADTLATFKAFIHDTGDGPFLRTGDLGFIHDGELFVTGRLKDVLILRGRNLYSHDIELSAGRCHEVLRPGCTAAFSLADGFEERLVILQEIRREQEHQARAAISAIRRAILKEHGVSPGCVSLFLPGTLPKTTSGKLQRSRCKAAYLSGELQPAMQDGSAYGSNPAEAPPRNRTEAALLGLWTALGNTPIGTKDRFAEFCDSLTLVEYLERIHIMFGLEISTADALDALSTVAGVAAYIEDLDSSRTDA